MKLSKLDSSAERILRQTFEPKTVAEFYIDKVQFVVISDCNYKNKLNTSALSSQELNEQQMVGQFQFEGTTYGIFKEKNSVSKESLNLTEILTVREVQIATLVAQGKSNKQIAKQLQISKWTVSTHLRRIFMKLRVDNRAAMVYSCSTLLNGRW